MACVVRSARGVAFTFGASGHTDGTVVRPNSINRDWDFNATGVNSQIAANWADLVPGTAVWDASTSLTVGPLIAEALQGAGFVSLVIDVVKALA